MRVREDAAAGGVTTSPAGDDVEAARQRRELWRAVYVPSVLMAIGEGMLVPVLPLYVAELGAGFALVGLALAGEAIGMLLGDLPAGALLRRFQRRRLMLAGVALVGLAVALVPTTGAVLAVVALRVVAGLGAAMWNLSRHAYLTESVKAAARGRSIATFGGATRFGLLIGPALGGAVAGAFGMPATFLAFALTAAVAWAVCVRFLEPRPEPEGPSQRLGHAAALRGVLARRRGLLMVTGLGFLMGQTIRSGRRIILPLYGSAVLGLDVEMIGVVVSIAAAFDLALFPLAGQIMDRWGRKFTIVPCFAIQGLGMALVPLAGGFVGLALVGAVMGIGNGLGSGSMMTLGADLAPRDAIGEFLGVWRLIGDAGGMGGPVAVGAIADLLTLATATLVIAVIGVGAATVFAFGVPETFRRAPPPAGT